MDSLLVKSYFAIDEEGLNSLNNHDSVINAEYIILNSFKDKIRVMEYFIKIKRKRLVELFVNNIEDEDKWNKGMLIAVENSNEELIDYFISKGADDFEWGMFYAAKYTGKKKIVDIFISKGACNWKYAFDYAEYGKQRHLQIYFAYRILIRYVKNNKIKSIILFFKSIIKFFTIYIILLLASSLLTHIINKYFFKSTVIGLLGSYIIGFLLCPVIHNIISNDISYKEEYKLIWKYKKEIFTSYLITLITCKSLCELFDYFYIEKTEMMKYTIIYISMVTSLIGIKKIFGI